jgi:hypothetical protein
MRLFLLQGQFDGIFRFFSGVIPVDEQMTLVQLEQRRACGKGKESYLKPILIDSGRPDTANESPPHDFKLI